MLLDLVVVYRYFLHYLFMYIFIIKMKLEKYCTWILQKEEDNW